MSEPQQTLSFSSRPPARLASEEVIISAPMSYAGSAQRIFRLRRRASSSGAQAAMTGLAVALTLIAWAFITVWYLIWGFWLVPYRLLRRGARKRKAEALRHRELLGTIQGAAAASAAAIVSSSTIEAVRIGAPPEEDSHIRVDSEDRDRAVSALHTHYVAGRLTHDELEERVSQAHASRTRGDLASLLHDLPSLPADRLPGALPPPR